MAGRDTYVFTIVFFQLARRLNVFLKKKKKKMEINENDDMPSEVPLMRFVFAIFTFWLTSRVASKGPPLSSGEKQ